MTVINTSSPLNRTTADYETHAASGTKSINVPPPPKNAVEQHEPHAPPPQTQGPASGARDATQPTSKGYAATKGPSQQEIDAATQQVKDLQLMSSLPNKFNHDAEEGIFSLEWVRAVANDGWRFPHERDAARRLLDSGAWALADADHSGKLTLGEASAYASQLQGKAPAPSAGSTGRTPSDADIGGSKDPGRTSDTKEPKKTVQDVMDSVPKPERSTKPGMEGALDNLGNTADYLQKQMEAVANDPDLDPAAKSAKLQNLQFQQQSAMNMLTQLSQMMQNTIKLWSDIAMNSVRNIK